MITAINSLDCWGQNIYGQLGTGDNTNHDTPQTVDLGIGRTAVYVSTGKFHTCAVLDDGSLKCWGLTIMVNLELAHRQSLQHPKQSILE